MKVTLCLALAACYAGSDASGSPTGGPPGSDTGPAASGSDADTGPGTSASEAGSTNPNTSTPDVGDATTVGETSSGESSSSSGGASWDPPDPDELGPGLMFAFGGSRACGSGGFGTDTWIYDFEADAWFAMNPTGDVPPPAILISEYDHETELVFARTEQHLYAYSLEDNSWTRLSPNEFIPNFGTAGGVIDPARRQFVFVSDSGGEAVGYVTALDGPDWDLVPFPMSGDVDLLLNGGEGARSPGLAYDPAHDRILGWGGADIDVAAGTVYVLNVANGVWTAVSPPGGPSASGARGTFGRWRYSITSDRFIALNRTGSNAFAFDYDGGGSGTWTELPDTQLSTLDPGVPGNHGSVVGAWSGGVFDDAENRLIIWGGGHNDYSGNEIYAVDLDDGSLAMIRSPGPTPEGWFGICHDADADGDPVSRHTYGNLAYIARPDR